MILINVRKSLKVIAINCLVLIIPFVLLEVYFLHDKLDYRTKGVTCSSKLTNYDYCPSITHLRYMELADSWFPIVNYIDENKKSAYKDTPVFSSNGRRIFLIGDSFIQAEELHIEDRFEHALRKEGFDVYAFGYSSWNSKQFNAIVKSLDLRVGDEVIVFSMGNDYTPSYARSTIKTTLDVKDDMLAKADTRKLWTKIYDNSLLANTFRRAKAIVSGRLEKKDKDKERTAQNVVSYSHNRENWKDCDSLPSVNDVASSLVHDYLSLSKHEDCWSKDIQESVELNINLLSEASKVVRSQGANFKIAFVPAGWAFPNQNTIGRKHSLYNVPEGVSVSQVGLSDKLIGKHFEVLDLEKLLGKHTEKGANYLYFPVDGHFTKDAHRIIGDYLIGILK